MENLYFKIRHANLEDLNYILNIESDAFIDGIRENSNVIEERIKTFQNGFFLVCSKDSYPIGYISSEIWKYKEIINTEDFILGHSISEVHNDKGDELYISSMGILKSARGKKLGSSLFNYLIEYIRNNYPNIKSAILIVCDEWNNAKKIYSNAGFKEVSIIKNFFISEDNNFADGIIMRKKL